MNNIQVIFQYQNLVLEGDAEPVLCIDNSHVPMHPFVNADDMTVRFECLECNYKVLPGLAMIEKMRAFVEKAHHDS